MKILQIMDIPNCDCSGVASAVKKYLKYESKLSDVALYTLDDNMNSEYAPVYNYNDYKKISDLPEPYNKPDLVVFNEVYKPKYLKLYKECLKRKIKYIIIPHGCLVEAAQNKKKMKKIIGNVLFFEKFIKNANAIQFLNENEKKNTKLKYKNHIICGNGVEIPNSQNTPKNKNLLYIGRYDINVKGLDIMAQLCKKYYSWFKKNKVQICLYGKASEMMSNKLIDMVKELKIEDVMVINGPIYGNEKEEKLLQCYGFIQLSRNEGQPMGILEALSYGVPCVVTYNTTFGEYVNKNKCGFGVTLDVDIIFNKIKELYENNDRRKEMSNNAKKNIVNDYNWEKVILNTCDQYKNIFKNNKF